MGESKLQRRRWPCPCCGYLTFGGEPPGTYDICDVCFWEDDAVQFDNPDSRDGANSVSLRECRADFEKWRAAGYPADPYRRAPTPDEMPPVS